MTLGPLSSVPLVYGLGKLFNFFRRLKWKPAAEACLGIWSGGLSIHLKHQMIGVWMVVCSDSWSRLTIRCSTWTKTMPSRFVSIGCFYRFLKGPRHFAGLSVVPRHQGPAQTLPVMLYR